ncbi:hypothetical protein RUM43_000531, partial [Polyplax serrata]
GFNREIHDEEEDDDEDQEKDQEKVIFREIFLGQKEYRKIVFTESKKVIKFITQTGRRHSIPEKVRKFIKPFFVYQKKTTILQPHLEDHSLILDLRIPRSSKGLASK